MLSVFESREYLYFKSLLSCTVVVIAYFVYTIYSHLFLYLFHNKNVSFLVETVRLHPLVASIVPGIEKILIKFLLKELMLFYALKYTFVRTV